MADDNARIEQFQKLANVVPYIELGHFSLGRAYLDAGRHADALRPHRGRRDRTQNGTDDRERADATTGHAWVRPPNCRYPGSRGRDVPG